MYAADCAKIAGNTRTAGLSSQAILLELRNDLAVQPLWRKKLLAALVPALCAAVAV